MSTIFTYLILLLVFIRLSVIDAFRNYFFDFGYFKIGPDGLFELLPIFLCFIIYLKYRPTIKKNALFYVLLAFLGINTLLTAFSINPYPSVKEVIKLLNYLLLFTIGYNFFNTWPRFKKLLVTLVIGLLAITALGFYQGAVTGGNFETWSFPNRLSGPYAHPNNFAFILAFLLIFLIGSALMTLRNIRLTIISILIGFCGLMALIATMTRGAWIALFVASLLLLILVYRQRVFKWLAWFIVALVIINLGYTIISATDVISSASQFSPIARIIGTNFSDDDSLRSRLLIWQDSWGVFQAHWKTGIGLANFEPAVLDYRQDIYSEGLAAHNDFIRFSVESGILGLLAFIALGLTWLITMIKSLLRSSVSNLPTPDSRLPTSRLIGSTVFTAGLVLWIGLLFDNIFFLVPLNWPFWLITGAWLGFYPACGKENPQLDNKITDGIIKA